MKKRQTETQRQTDILIKLRKRISFLNEIPDRIYFQLDTSEFLIPKGKVAKIRLQLEKELGHFIMTYKRTVFTETVPLKSHLCANIQSASLTGEQEKILKSYEEMLSRYKVGFVAYKNPLELILLEESPLFDYYRVKGLL